MALHQNDVAEGRTPVAVAHNAGVEVVNIFKHTFAAAFTASGDVLEIGMLPGGVRLTELTLIGDTITASQTASIGILDGDFGAPDDSRDFDGSAIATGLDVDDAAATVPVGTVIDVAGQSQNKGLGIKLTQNVAAGAGTLIVIAKHIATPK
jgi:hypothetical protein